MRKSSKVFAFLPADGCFAFLKKKYQSSPPQNKPKLSLPGRLARLLLLCQNLLGTYFCWVLSLYYRPGKPPLCPLWHCRNAEGPIDVRPPSVCCGFHSGHMTGGYSMDWTLREEMVPRHHERCDEDMPAVVLPVHGLSHWWAIVFASQGNSGSPFRP